MQALEEARRELTKREEASAAADEALADAKKFAKERVERARSEAERATKPVETQSQQTRQRVVTAAAHVKRLEEMLYVALEEIKARVERSF